MTVPAVVRCLVLIAGLVAALPTSAQEDKRPNVRPTGLDFNIGVVSPENATTDLVLGGTLHLGTIFRRWLHFSSGFTVWSSDADSTHFDGRDGKLNDFRVFADLRVNLFKWKILRPYVMGGGALHFVSAEIPSDQTLEDALSSTNAGWELGLGVVVGRQWRATVEARKELVSDVGNWSLNAGLGFAWGDVPPPDRTSPTPPPPEEPESNPAAIELEQELSEMSLFYPQTASVKGDDEGVLLVVPASALFAPNDAFLDPAAVGELSRLASLLRGKPVSSITIAGHTDLGANPDADMRLSQQRAETVKQILSGSGVESNRIVAVGHGASRPVASNDTPEGRARNRRMEIELVVP